MLASHARDPGATPGGSTHEHSPVVQRQRRLAHIQETMVRFHPGLLKHSEYASGRAARASRCPWLEDIRKPEWLQVRLLLRDAICPDTPIGRAVRLKPGRLQVRVLLWVLQDKRLGRQLADHLGLDPWMLWVRIPPGPLEYNTPSWSSLECSPPCHGGGRRFKSDRGCLDGAVRQLGRATDFKSPWMWVRLPPVLLKWVVLLAAACKAAVSKEARWATRGSIPSRPTDKRPVRLAAGCETLILAAWVRFPYGSLT